MMLLPVNIHALMTGRAPGIPKMLRAMRANGSPTPKVQTDEDRTCLTMKGTAWLAAPRETEGNA
jgi:hypothetical protein